MTNQRFCPDCGSENVEPDFRRTNVLGEMIFNQNKWVCNDCGYTGIMPSGDSEEVETQDQDEDSDDGEGIEFEEKREKDESVDPSAGRAYLKYILYFLIPLTLIYYIFLAFQT